MTDIITDQLRLPARLQSRAGEEGTTTMNTMTTPKTTITTMATERRSRGGSSCKETSSRGAEADNNNARQTTTTTTRMTVTIVSQAAADVAVATTDGSPLEGATADMLMGRAEITAIATTNRLRSLHKVREEVVVNTTAERQYRRGWLRSPR